MTDERRKALIEETLVKLRHCGAWSSGGADEDAEVRAVLEAFAEALTGPVIGVGDTAYVNLKQLTEDAKRYVSRELVSVPDILTVRVTGISTDPDGTKVLTVRMLSDVG